MHQSQKCCSTILHEPKGSHEAYHVDPDSTDKTKMAQASTCAYLGVQKVLRDFPLRFGTRKGVGEEEHPLAAIHDKEVVRYVGSAQALACLSHHRCQVLHRVARLKHQTTHLQ